MATLCSQLNSPVLALGHVDAPHRARQRLDAKLLDELAARLLSGGAARIEQHHAMVAPHPSS
jgi:hypothetical protein